MRYLAITLSALASHSCLAAVFKCELAGGKVEYQAAPCKSGKAAPLNLRSGQLPGEPPSFPPLPDDQPPEVVGDAVFRARVHEALALLKAKDGQAYSIVAGYVGRIAQSPHSGMNATAKPPTFEMSDATAMYSVSWAAATIAHDAYHSKLYHDHKGAHPERPVPNGAWGGTDAEIKCNRFQINVMRKIGAPQREIDHALVNSDGHYIGQDIRTRKY